MSEIESSNGDLHREDPAALSRRVAELERTLAERERTIVALRKDVERLGALEAEQQKLIAVVECSLDFIAMATTEGQVFYLNDAGRRMVGLDTMEEVQRTSIPDYLTPEDAAFAMQTIVPAVMTQGKWQGDFRFRHFKTGAIIPVHYSVFTIRDRNTGDLIALGTVTRDISDRKEAEEERAKMQDEMIRIQSLALEELSTPLIPITDDLVVMPLIGTVDTVRVQRVMETLLNGVIANRAKTVILDITGVTAVDSAVANALLRAAQAVSLLGARTVLTGISPHVAQTLVQLGIELHGIITRNTLQSGIAWATAEGNRPESA